MHTNTNKLLFISYNSSCTSVYNPHTKKTNQIDFTNLNNLATENYIVTCNKHLLKKYLKNSILDTKVKDILYLYAIIFPIKFINNTIISLAKVLDVSIPKSLDEQSYILYKIYDTLLKHLSNLSKEKKSNILTISNFISINTCWDWENEIKCYLNNIKENNFKVWEQISNIKSISNNIKFCNIHHITEDVTLKTLYKCVERFGGYRKFQKEYALSMSKMFNINESISNTQLNNQENSNNEIKTNIVFSEAGTGIGKTLGYLAPVLAFIENNPKNRVVISTYSRALQAQILNELKKCLDKEQLNNNVALIKGNHNYICLLNLENLFSNIDKYKDGYLFLGFILRWLQETESGDILGGDFLPWLNNIISNEIINNVVNRRDECIYSSCKHYKKCFITKIKEKAKNSNIIISNHSLTLLNKFNSDYFIFDEAHNLYNVCDEVYKKELSAQKGQFLKKWLIGNKYISKNSNMMLDGLKNRVKHILCFLDKEVIKTENNSIYNKNLSQIENFKKDINTYTYPSKEILQQINSSDIDKTNVYEGTDLSEEEVINFKLNRLVDILVNAANFLPNEDYLVNINNHSPKNIFEEFLYYIYNHVLLHNSDLNQYYTIESKPVNLSEDLKNTAYKLNYKLKTILEVGNKIKDTLSDKITFIKNKEDKDILLEFINSYEYNCLNIIKDFIDLLNELLIPNNKFIYRFVVLREESNIYNIGYFKNLLNPLEEFNNRVINGKKGVSFTSATLFDNVHNDDISLLNKFVLDTNKVNIVSNISVKSPFDYVKNSKILIFKQNYSKNSDLRNEALLQLFLASQGGVLVVFTSIQRLRDHYNKLKNNLLLQENEINIFAQHEEINKSTSIVKLFKEDENSCLLGSDSFRDGIDIPGKSLRMVIFEKVPWPKPDILFNARKNIYGNDIETQNVKLKLKQAFGRILRKEDDRGVFIILEPNLPSKYLDAFPENIEIQKLSLEKVIRFSKDFFKNYIKN